MNSKKYQRLTLAIALGVGVSAAALPHGFAAAESTAEGAPVLSDTASSATHMNVDAPVANAPTLTTSPAASSSDERAGDARW